MENYYVFSYEIDATEINLIWFSNDPDGFVLNSAGLIIGFLQTSTLYEYANKSNIHLESEEPTLCNIDLIQQWLYSPEDMAIDSKLFLSVWNFFEDLAASTNDPWHSQNQKKTHKVYEKIFWGNNLPSVTPPGETYRPSWNQREIEILREVFIHGLHNLRVSVEIYP